MGAGGGGQDATVSFCRSRGDGGVSWRGAGGKGGDGGGDGGRGERGGGRAGLHAEAPRQEVNGLQQLSSARAARLGVFNDGAGLAQKVNNTPPGAPKDCAWPGLAHHAKRQQACVGLAFLVGTPLPSALFKPPQSPSPGECRGRRGPVQRGRRPGAWRQQGRLRARRRRPGAWWQRRWLRAWRWRP